MTAQVHDRQARRALAACEKAQAAVRIAYDRRALAASTAWDAGCSMREIATAMGMSLGSTHKVIHAARVAAARAARAQR